MEKRVSAGGGDLEQHADAGAAAVVRRAVLVAVGAQREAGWGAALGAGEAVYDGDEVCGLLKRNTVPMELAPP